MSDYVGRHRYDCPLGIAHFHDRGCFRGGKTRELPERPGKHRFVLTASQIIAMQNQMAALDRAFAALRSADELGSDDG